MPPPVEERRPAITPQLAVRVAVLGGIAFVLFAVVFFRLWFLQVLTGEDYVSQARENRVRKIKIEAPRGNIVDRNGQMLVKTRVAPVVQITPDSLPAAELRGRRALPAGRAPPRRPGGSPPRASSRRCGAPARRRAPLHEGRAARAPPAAARRQPGGAGAGRPHPGGRAGAAQPLPAARRASSGHGAAGDPPRGHRGHRRGAVLQRDDQDRRRQGRVLLPARAPGGVPRRRGREALPARLPVQRARRPAVRDAARDLARRAQAAALPRRRARARASARTGSRRPTTATCAGSDGYTRVVINALGNRDDTRSASQRRPIQGQQLRLTLDLGLQRAANDALRARDRGRQHQRQQRDGGRVRGHGPDERRGARARLLSELRREPVRQADLAVASSTRSTRRPTARRCSTARSPRPIRRARRSSRSPRSPRSRAGSSTRARSSTTPAPTRSATCVLQNARGASYGPLAVTQALKVSSDIFFYTLGERANPLPGEVIQTWAKRLGLGRPTGIDIPGEPTASCRTRSGATRATPSTSSARSATRSRSARAPRCSPAAASSGRGRPATTSTSPIGQGDLQATPLQMAVAYSTIVNGGRVVRAAPRLEDRGRPGPPDRGDQPSPRGARSTFSRLNQQAIMEGLRGAAMEEGGTSAAVFMAGFPLNVYGKTGTVERAGQPDQSWYVAYVPHPTRPIVVAVTVEQGGFGAETAAPAARLILSEWFDTATGRSSPGRARTDDRPHVPSTLAAPREHRDPDRAGLRAAAAAGAARVAPAARPAAAARGARPRRLLGHRAQGRDRRRHRRRAATTTSSARRIYGVVGLVAHVRRLAASTTRGCASSST